MHGKLRIYVNEDQSQDQARLRLNLQSDSYTLYPYDALTGIFVMENKMLNCCR